MIIFVKLIQALLLGALMLFSVMLLFVAGTFFIGFIAELLGLDVLAEYMYALQKRMWLRIKKWFFRYKEIEKEEK